MHLNLWNNKKILRRSALFGAACGSLAIASMGRAQGRSQDLPSIAGIHDAMQSFVDRKEITGAVTMVVDKDRSVRSV
ncbi:MAG: hypothetical protein ACK5LQ_12580 [Planctomycetota bacterium]